MNEASDSNFVTRKWSIVNDSSSASYDAGNEIIYSKEDLRYSICDFNGAYILVWGVIIIIGNWVT